MNAGIPTKPIGVTPKWYFMRKVWEYLFGGQFPIKGVGGVKVQWANGNYEVSSAVVRQTQTQASGELQTYRVKSKVGDVLFCVTWDGTDEGEDEIPIAVNHNSRQLTSETINGTTYTYTDYTDLDEFNSSRDSDDGATNETQIVTPMWYQDCEIAVMPINWSGVEYDDTINEPYDLKLIEVSARCWAMIEPAV